MFAPPKSSYLGATLARALRDGLDLEDKDDDVEDEDLLRSEDEDEEEREPLPSGRITTRIATTTHNNANAIRATHSLFGVARLLPPPFPP